MSRLPHTHNSLDERQTISLANYAAARERLTKEINRSTKIPVETIAKINQAAEEGERIAQSERMLLDLTSQYYDLLDENVVRMIEAADELEGLHL